MITQLTAAEVSEWQEIRLECLREAPTAFTQSVAAELKKKDVHHLAQVSLNDIFAWRDEAGKIGGVIGYFVELSEKASHRGGLFGLYVREQYRGRGVAEKLLLHAINHAEGKVTQLHLSVTEGNDTALSLYTKHGFSIYGTEPRSLKVDGAYYDKHLLVKYLDR